MNNDQYTIFRSMVESFAEGKEKALAEIKTRKGEDFRIQLALESRCEGEAVAYRQVLTLLDTVKNSMLGGQTT